MKMLSIIAIALSIGAAVSAPAWSQEDGMKMDDMMDMNMDDMPCCEDVAHGVGIINSVDVDAKKVNLTHEPIDKIGWGTMTMDFETGEMVDLEQFAKGESVYFMLTQGEDKAYDIALMCPAGGDPNAYKASMEKMMEGGNMEDVHCMNGSDQDHAH